MESFLRTRASSKVHVGEWIPLDTRWVTEPRAQGKGNGANLESAPCVRMGDSEVVAFPARVRSHERAIYLAAFALLNNADAALEVTRETVIQAFRSLPKSGREEHLRIWLIGIALGEARAFLRGRLQINCDEVFKDDQVDPYDWSPCQFAEWRPISSEALAHNRTGDCLRDCVGALARKDRVVLLLRDALHLTTTETAEALGISGLTAKARLARARFQVCGDLARSNTFAPQIELEFI